MTQTLLRPRRLAANVVWNLAGQGLPMLVALVCIPPLVTRLGNERFGILSIAWMLVGYFSLLDFGLGWALTRTVAQKLGTGDVSGMPQVIWPALIIMAMLSALGGILLGMAAPWLATRVLDITPALQGEATVALLIMALTLPTVVVGAGLRGILEAHQRFIGINVLRSLQGCFNFLAPLAVTAWSVHLGWFVAVLAVSRFLVCVILLIMCLRAVPALRTQMTLNLTGAMPLLRLGGWMTASNVISPLMANCDRFLAAVLLPMSVIPLYTVPYDFMSRLLIAPAAICGVLFPALSTALAGDAAQVGRLLRGGMVTVMSVTGPICLVLGVFAPEFLQAWLGADFARDSAAILRIFALGIILSTAATVPFSALMAAGQARQIAWIQGCELLLYVPLLTLAILCWGLPGIALIWALRAAADAVVLSLVLVRRLPAAAPALVRSTLLGATFLLPIILSFWCPAPGDRLAVCLAGLGLALGLGLQRTRSLPTPA